MLSPIEAPAEDTFHNQVVGTSGRADTNTDIDLPLGRNVEIGYGEDLLLLIVKRVEGADAAIICVVFQPAADDRGEVITDFCRRREANPSLGIGTVPSPLQRRIDSEVPTPGRLVNNRTYLPCPCIWRINFSLVADLSRNTKADWPMPRVRHTHAGTDVIADPLNAAAVLLAGEDIEADFEPGVDPLRKFERFVLLVVRGIDPIDDVLLSFCREIRMQFDHQAFRRHGICTIDLNFVVSLRAGRRRNAGESGC